MDLDCSITFPVILDITTTKYIFEVFSLVSGYITFPGCKNDAG